MTLVLILLSQFFFLFFRTLNVRYIAQDKIVGALITGGSVNVLWIITTWIGVKAMDDRDIPTIVAYLVGALAGTYYGMREKQILRFIQYWMYCFAISYECKPDGLHILEYRGSIYAINLKGASKKEVIKKFIHDYTNNKINFEVQKGYFFNLN